MRDRENEIEGKVSRDYLSILKAVHVDYGVSKYSCLVTEVLIELVYKGWRYFGRKCDVEHYESENYI